MAVEFGFCPHPLKKSNCYPVWHTAWLCSVTWHSHDGTWHGRAVAHGLAVPWHMAWPCRGTWSGSLQVPCCRVDHRGGRERRTEGILPSTHPFPPDMMVEPNPTDPPTHRPTHQKNKIKRDSNSLWRTLSDVSASFSKAMSDVKLPTALWLQPNATAALECRSMDVTRVYTVGCAK